MLVSDLVLGAKVRLKKPIETPVGSFPRFTSVRIVGGRAEKPKVRIMVDVEVPLDYLETVEESEWDEGNGWIVEEAGVPELEGGGQW